MVDGCNCSLQHEWCGNKAAGEGHKHEDACAVGGKLHGW
jgi:hypothetical protein